MSNRTFKKHNTRLLIVGAGDHGRVVADCAEQLSRYDTIEFLDDSFNHDDEATHVSGNWPVLDKVDQWQKYTSRTDFIVAFGNNQLRLSTHEHLRDNGVSLASVIHPNTVISQYSKIGAGTVVLAGAVVNFNSVIGEACIINTLASVDHDCSIKNGVHLAPRSSLAGGVSVGDLSWLGIGCVVIEYKSIASNIHVGAGAVVIKNLEHVGVYVGNPARKLQ